jgi:hypothetical protein
MFNHYKFLLQQIENEKVILIELSTNREKYVLKLYAYDGDYKGMAVITENLRHLNKRIEQTKTLLNKLTKKYEYILRHSVR